MQKKKVKYIFVGFSIKVIQAFLELFLLYVQMYINVSSTSGMLLFEIFNKPCDYFLHK